MAVEWNHDLDAALARAKAENRPVLIDFSATPA
jgi:thiamine pyrophosphate-dependent acetolactate synthase large subunit-like protein